MYAAGVNLQQTTSVQVNRSVTPLRKWLFPPMAFLLGAMTAMPASARDCGSPPEPYRASYSVNRGGDPDGAMTVTLERTGPDSYRYNMDTRVKWGIFNAYIEEQSDLSFRNGMVLPESFELIQRVSFYKRREVVEFNWASKKASGEKKGAKFELDIVPGMQDKLSIYLFLADSLCRAEYDIDADVVSGPVLKSFDYRFQAIEPVDSALGRLEAIHIRRGGPEDDEQTDLWHAGEANFLPLRILYRDEGVITDMRLIEISFKNE